MLSTSYVNFILNDRPHSEKKKTFRTLSRKRMTLIKQITDIPRTFPFLFLLLFSPNLTAPFSSGVFFQRSNLPLACL